MRFWCSISVLTGGLCFVAGAIPASAQRALNGPAAQPRVSSQPKQGQFKQQKQGKGKMAPLPAPDLQRLMNMTPEQRERALSRLPPERRALVEQRLDNFQRQFSRLQPEQQEALEQRYEVFSKLPQERRTAIRQEVMELRAMTPAQRAEFLSSDEARQKFSADELGILRGVAGVPEP